MFSIFVGVFYGVGAVAVLIAAVLYLKSMSAGAGAVGSMASGGGRFRINVT